MSDESQADARAYALALRFLDIRPRSRREVADYLLRKGEAAGEIDAAIERLERAGLIDDAKFADSWIASRMALRPRSRMVLAGELAAKGVAREVIAAALAEIESDQELEALRRLVERKRRSGYVDDAKLTAYLQRQGYQWSLIKQALERPADENPGNQA